MLKIKEFNKRQKKTVYYRWWIINDDVKKSLVKNAGFNLKYMMHQHTCDWIWWQAVYLRKYNRFALVRFWYLSRSPYINHFELWNCKYFLWKINLEILSWNDEMKNVSYTCTAFIWADVQCPLYLQLWNYKMFTVLNCDARVIQSAIFVTTKAIYCWCQFGPK